MRILIVTDRMQLGGAETHIYTLIEGLLCAGHLPTLMTSGGVYADELERRGVRIIHSPLDKRTPSSYLSALKIMEKTIGAYDIVHAHTRYSAYVVGKARGKRTFPAIVCTAHLNFRVKPFRKIAFWGDITLSVSKDIRDYLIREYGVKPERIRLTKNGIDLTHFKRERQGDEKLIVNVSRIDEGRSLCAFLLCDAAVKIISEHPGTRIIIVGDGNRFSALSARVAAVNSALGFEGIRAVGAITDVRPILEGAGIFVGVSRAALEAMAMELPAVICGDEGYGGIYYPSSAEAVESSNLCARGFPLPSADALYRDISLLLEDGELSRRLGRESATRIREKYGAYSMVNDAFAAYREVLRPRNTLLLGYIGYGNFGDEAAYNAVRRELEERCGANIRTLTAPESRNINDGLFNRFSPIDIIRAVHSSDSLIIAGGNLLQNETGMLSLIYYCAIIAYARRRKMGIFMLGVGFGEVYGNFSGRLLKKALSRANYIGARTASDLEVARYLSSEVESRLMPDLCFLYGKSNISTARKYFAVIGADSEFFSRIPIADIKEKFGITPILIVLFKKEDAAAATEFGKAHDIECFCPETIDELCRHLSRCKFTMTERLHGAVFSLLCMTPVFIKDTALKNEALINEIAGRAQSLGTASPLLPLKKDGEFYRTPKKEEIEAESFDFPDIIRSLISDTESALDAIF